MERQCLERRHLNEQGVQVRRVTKRILEADGDDNTSH